MLVKGLPHACLLDRKYGGKMHKPAAFSHHVLSHIHLACIRFFVDESWRLQKDLTPHRLQKLALTFAPPTGRLHNLPSSIGSLSPSRTEDQVLSANGKKPFGD
jgi:hypothetical protein